MTVLGDEERTVECGNGRNEKKIERKLKSKKHKESTMEQEEPTSENVEISHMERDHRKHKDKKRNKGKKDNASNNHKDSGEGELTDVYGENSSEPPLNCAERKRKRKEKKNDRFDNTYTEEIEGSGSKKLEEKSITRKGNSKESNGGKKKQKLENNHEDGKIQVVEKAMEIFEKKKKRKDKEKRTGNDAVWSQDAFSEAKHSEGDVQSSMDDVHATKESETKKKKSKKKENCKDGSSMDEVHATKESERKKKKKSKKNENCKDDSSVDVHATKESGRMKKKKSKKNENCKDDSSTANGSNDLERIQDSEVENANKKKRLKKNTQSCSEDGQDNDIKHANKEKKRNSIGLSDGKPNKSSKKVRFSGEDEVFTLPVSMNSEENDKDDMVRGKRFTRAEDEIVKQAVLDYIKENSLGDEGLEMILYSKNNPKLKGCWREIASAIPYRPYVAIYSRARVLFMRSESRKWSQEDYDMVLKYHELHGSQWKALADEMGKHAWHVKDTYRRIKLRNVKKGHWSQIEYQKLFDLVNTDLQEKLSEDKRSKHGMLRDNIAWSAISDELSTRNQSSCCHKWYRQLTSPMVAEGVWADSDDYRLLSELYYLDATCMEDVDWDDLIEHRSGDLCRKRWNQMALHIGHHGRKSFAEQVDILAHRYCPNLLEARQIWDSKPRVP